MPRRKQLPPLRSRPPKNKKTNKLNTIPLSSHGLMFLSLLLRRGKQGRVEGGRLIDDADGPESTRDPRPVQAHKGFSEWSLNAMTRKSHLSSVTTSPTHHHPSATFSEINRLIHYRLLDPPQPLKKPQTRVHAHMNARMHARIHSPAVRRLAE